MSKRLRPPGYLVLHHDPASDITRTVGIYEDPYEAREAASRFNRNARQDEPVESAKFSFYYVEPRRHFEMLPWLESVADLLDVGKEEAERQEEEHEPEFESIDL